MAKSALDRIKGVVKSGTNAVTRVVPEEERALTVGKMEPSNVAWYDMDRIADASIVAQFGEEAAPFVALAIRMDKIMEFHRQVWEGTLKVDFPHMDRTLQAHGLKRVYSVSPMVVYSWALGVLKFRKDAKIRDRYTVTIITANKLAAKAIIDAISMWINVSAPPSPETMVHTVVKINDEYEIVPLAPVTKSLERDNYPEGTLSGFDLVVKQFGSDKPVSRLALITGPAGSGKTALLMGFVSALPKQTCVYVPATLVDSLGSPSFMSLLRKQAGKSLVLIVEDSSEYHDLAGVSQLATNFVGAALNLRVLLVSTTPVENIDPQLKSPGRLLEHLQLAPLSVEHANKLYAKLTKGAAANFTDPTTLGEVYALANAFTLAKK